MADFSSPSNVLFRRAHGQPSWQLAVRRSSPAKQELSKQAKPFIPESRRISLFEQPASTTVSINSWYYVWKFVQEVNFHAQTGGIRTLHQRALRSPGSPRSPRWFYRLQPRVDAAHRAQERGTPGGPYGSVACERETSIAASLGGAVGVVGPSGS